MIKTGPRKGLVAALIVVATIALAYNWYSSRPTSEEKSPKEKPELLHCSKCSYEQPYLPSFQGQPCPKCRVGRLRPSTHALTQRVPFTRDPVALGLVSLTAALLGAYCYLRFLHRDSGEGSREYLYSRCEKCERRIRYEARPFARKILCPTCKWEQLVPGAEHE